MKDPEGEIDPQTFLLKPVKVANILISRKKDNIMTKRKNDEKHNLNDYIQKLLRKKEKTVAVSFNFTYRYKDDILSLKHSKFGDSVERIHPTEFEQKKRMTDEGTV